MQDGTCSKWDKASKPKKLAQRYEKEIKHSATASIQKVLFASHYPNTMRCNIFGELHKRKKPRQRHLHSVESVCVCVCVCLCVCQWTRALQTSPREGWVYRTKINLGSPAVPHSHKSPPGHVHNRLPDISTREDCCHSGP